MAKVVSFGLDPNIYDAKTDHFIPFGANVFVYLKHISIQILEKITGKNCKLCLIFGPSTGLKKLAYESSPLGHSTEF